MSNMLRGKSHKKSVSSYHNCFGIQWEDFSKTICREPNSRHTYLFFPLPWAFALLMTFPFHYFFLQAGVCILKICACLLIFIDLKGRDRWWKRYSICCFTPHRATMVRNTWGWDQFYGSQKSGTLPSVAEVQFLRASPLPVRACLSRKLEMGAEADPKASHSKRGCAHFHWHLNH